MSLSRGVAAAAAGLLCWAPIGSGAAAQDFSYGRLMFERSCAACHGEAGLGDGPVAGFFKNRPKNLQLLATANNGVFPFSEVYQAIDGRRELLAHGTRAMPVWGDIFMAEAMPDTFHPGHDAEEIVQGRILAITYYLQSVQK